MKIVLDTHLLIWAITDNKMLLAQCKTDKMALLTHDEILKYYNEECIRIVWYKGNMIKRE